jgi:hypothetical protein
MKVSACAGRTIHKRPALAKVSSTLRGSDDGSGFALIVDARFNEDDAESFFGALRYTLKRAAITIDFEGCSAAIINSEIDSDFLLASEQERTFELKSDSGNSVSKEYSGGFDISAQTFKIKNSVKSGGSSNQSKGVAETVSMKFNRHSIGVGGTSKSLRFVFDPPLPTLSLRGKVRPDDWCTLKLGPRSGKVTTTLTVAPRDVEIQGVGGIWPDEISTDKWIIIHHWALKYIDIKDFLSLSELNIILIKEDEVGGNNPSFDDDSAFIHA